MRNTCDHSKSLRTVRNQLQTLGNTRDETVRSTSGHLGQFGTIRNHVKTFQTSPKHSQSMGNTCNHSRSDTWNSSDHSQLRLSSSNHLRQGSHSLRKGGCSAAAGAGIETTLLKRHGNWRSDAIFLYIKNSLRERRSVSRSFI
jgi:hypothetical protein